MLQIVFNEISAAEISQIPTLDQLELFSEFQISKADLQNLPEKSFGKIEHNGKCLYRFRAKDYRIYFEIVDDKVVVHRVLNKNSFSDFLFRSKLDSLKNEDDILKESKTFWKLIEEGKNAKQK